MRVRSHPRAHAQISTECRARVGVASAHRARSVGGSGRRLGASGQRARVVSLTILAQFFGWLGRNRDQGADVHGSAHRSDDEFSHHVHLGPVVLPIHNCVLPPWPDHHANNKTIHHGTIETQPSPSQPSPQRPWPPHLPTSAHSRRGLKCIQRSSASMYRLGRRQHTCFLMRVCTILFASFK